MISVKQIGDSVFSDVHIHVRDAMAKLIDTTTLWEICRRGTLVNVLIPINEQIQWSIHIKLESYDFYK